MDPQPKTKTRQYNTDNTGSSRPILFISARLLSTWSSTRGIAIVDPGKNTDSVSGMLPFDRLKLQSKGSSLTTRKTGRQELAGCKPLPA